MDAVEKLVESLCGAVFPLRRERRVSGHGSGLRGVCARRCAAAALMRCLQALSLETSLMMAVFCRHRLSGEIQPCLRGLSGTLPSWHLQRVDQLVVRASWTE